MYFIFYIIMNNYLLLIYILSFFISTYLFFQTSIKKYKPSIWFYKMILIFLAAICVFVSLFVKSDLNDKYIFGILLFLNIAILILIIKVKNKFIETLIIIGLIYLLLTFRLNDFIIDNGKLISVNKNWIYTYILILISFYLYTDNDILSSDGKIGNILLILFPLFFPLEEYFIHRIFTLYLLTAMRWNGII